MYGGKFKLRASDVLIRIIGTKGLTIRIGRGILPEHGMGGLKFGDWGLCRGGPPEGPKKSCLIMKIGTTS